MNGDTRGAARTYTIAASSVPPADAPRGVQRRVERACTEAFRACASVIPARCAFYLARADTEGLAFRMAVETVGWKLSSCLIWNKGSLVLGKGSSPPTGRRSGLRPILGPEESRPCEYLSNRTRFASDNWLSPCMSTYATLHKSNVKLP